MTLYYASENGHYDICQLFLQNSVEINAEGEHFGFTLEATSARGYENILQLLLAVNLTDGYYGCALQAALAEGHENVVRLLLKGADVNLKG